MAATPQTLIAYPTPGPGAPSLNTTLALAQPGDVIQLHGGAYPGIYRIDTPGLTLEPYQDESPVFTGPANFSSAKVAWLTIGEKAKGVTVRGLSLVREGEIAAVFSSGYSDFGIVIEGPDATVDGCTVRGQNKGVHLKGSTSTGATITNCRIGPTVQSCIVLATSKSVVRGALIAHNTLGGSYREDGIQFMPDFDLPLSDQANDVSNLGVIIYSNTISDCNENAIDLKGAGLIVIDGNTIRRALGSNDGALAWNRDARGAIMHGARTTSRRVIVRNNDVEDSLSGIRIYDEWKVYHNRILSNNTDYTGPNSAFVGKAPVFTGVEMGKGLVVGAAVRNNIIGGHKDADIAFYQNAKNGLTSNFNLYLGGEFALQYEGAWHYPLSLADWRALTGLDALSTAAVAMPAPDAIPAAGALTFTTGAGAGRVVKVFDAGFFTAWFGRSDLASETVYLGATPHLVVAVDYDKNELTLNEDTDWGDGTPVYWRTPTPRPGPIVTPSDPTDAAQITELHALLDTALAEIERMIAAAVVTDSAATANAATLAIARAELVAAQARIAAAQAALAAPVGGAA